MSETPKPADDPVIRTTALTKRYGGALAVDGLSLSVRSGEIYGFLGPNGSGKTTTMRMLLGAVEPTSGEIRLFGRAFDRADLATRERIGLVPERQSPGTWGWMSGLEYIRCFGELYGVPDVRGRSAFLLARVGLEEAGGRRIAGYSHGMLQRLSIARALLPDPELLFLDEPTVGLDALGVKQMRDLILAENGAGRTIFVSSHLLSEMERVCHRVAIIYRGRLLAEERTDALLSRMSPEREIQVDLAEAPDALASRIAELPFVLTARVHGASLFVQVRREGDHRRALSEEIIRLGLVPLRIEEREATLEEAFITITRDNVERLAGAAP